MDKKTKNPKTFAQSRRLCANVLGFFKTGCVHFSTG